MATAKRITADGVISAVPCQITGVTIYADSAAATTVKLYDDPDDTSSGTIVFEGGVDAVAKKAVHFNFSGDPIHCATGCYADGSFGAANHSVTVYIK